jgi:hypothetical protein
VKPLKGIQLVQIQPGQRRSGQAGLWRFYRLVRRLWHKWLTRRTRGKRLGWDTFQQLLARHPLLLPRICHAWTSTGSLA